MSKINTSWIEHTTADDDYSVDAYAKTSLETVLYWYTVAAIIIGLLVNTYVGLTMMLNRRSFLFTSHLSGIVLSNISFLFALSINFAFRSNGWLMSYRMCATTTFIMAVAQHMPTLCLTAIALERYINLYLRIWNMKVLHQPTWRQLCTTALLLVLCSAVHVWVIPLVSSTEFGCAVNYYDQGRQQLIESLMLFSVCIVYFIPFAISLTVNGMLLCRVYSNTRQIQQEVANNKNNALSTTNKEEQRKASRQLSKSNGAPVSSDQKLHSLIISFQCKQTSSDCSRLFIASSDSPSRSSPVNDSYTIVPKKLNKRISQNRRRALLMFVGIIFTDMALNFPNHFLNIVQRRIQNFLTSSPETAMIVHTLSYTMWHLQFVVSALCVKLPLFRRQRQQRLSTSRNVSPRKTTAISACINYATTSSI